MAQLGLRLEVRLHCCLKPSTIDLQSEGDTGIYRCYPVDIWASTANKELSNLARTEIPIWNLHFWGESQKTGCYEVLGKLLRNQRPGSTQCLGPTAWVVEKWRKMGFGKVGLQTGGQSAWQVGCWHLVHKIFNMFPRYSFWICLVDAINVFLQNDLVHWASILCRYNIFFPALFQRLLQCNS